MAIGGARSYALNALALMTTRIAQPLARSLALIFCAIHAASAKPAASVKDLREHFADCFQPPRALNGSRLTFYFSLTADGQIIGTQPRTVWFGLQASDKDRRDLLARASNALVTGCFPVSLDGEMARLISGDVLFLQFQVTSQGIQVFLGPYGSHASPDNLTYRRWR